MTKEKSGQADVGTPVAPTPPEGIELQSGAELIAIALESIATAIRNHQNSSTLRQVSGIGMVPQLSPEEAAKQAEVDKINRERLARFKADKKAMEKAAIEEERKRTGGD